MWLARAKFSGPYAVVTTNVGSGSSPSAAVRRLIRVSEISFRIVQGTSASTNTTAQRAHGSRTDIPLLDTRDATEAPFQDSFGALSPDPSAPIPVRTGAWIPDQTEAPFPDPAESPFLNPS